MKYLLKAVDTYRLDTLAEVENLHQAFLDDRNFELVAFNYKHKTTKDDDYFVVAATKIFTEEKTPDLVYDVNYEEV